MARTKNEWTLTSPEKIKEFRRTNSVSRLRFATALGVSATSVQNWEEGRSVAEKKTQAKMIEVMANPALVPFSRQSPGCLANTTDTSAELEATGKIVNAWLEQHNDLAPEDLAGVIRDVRQALRS